MYFEEKKFEETFALYSTHMETLEKAINSGEPSKANEELESDSDDSSEEDDDEDNDADEYPETEIIINPAIPIDNATKTKIKIFQIQQHDVCALLKTVNKISSTSSAGSASAYLKTLKTTWNDYRNTSREMRLLDIEIHNTKNFEELQSKYIRALGQLNDAINDSKNQAKNIELPKLKTPDFSGIQSEWRSFIEIFNKIIHFNKNVEKSLKMHYLKTSLKREAAKLVCHIEPSEENYTACYNLLRKRFDNKRETLNKLLDSILNLPKHKYENSRDLKNLHDTANECISSIHNLRIDVKSWGPIINHILMSKLDKSTIIHYECQLANVTEPQTFEKFLKYIIDLWLWNRLRQNHRTITGNHRTRVIQRMRKNHQNTNVHIATRIIQS